MDARDFGVEMDPMRSAEEDVKAYRGLSPAECYAHFLDLMGFTDLIMRSRPIEEWRRTWRRLDQLDDPGRWWERVPER